MPPTVVSITPADGAAGVWLHQPIRIAFSEPLAPESTQGATLSGPDGAPIAAQVVASSETELTVTADDADAAVGALHLALDARITDVAGNALAAAGATWQLAPWNRSELAGTTPSLAVDAAGRMVIARAVDGPGGRRIAVSAWTGAAWADLGGPLGARDAALPSVVLDAAGAPLVVWSEFPAQPGSDALVSVQAARWTGASWQALASPGEGSFAVIARPESGGDPILAYTAPAPAGSSLVRVRVLTGEQWQPLAAAGSDIPATGAVVGLPQLVALAPTMPVVVFAEMGGGPVPPQVRVLRWTGATGAWTETKPIAIVTAPSGEINRVSVAARGSDIVVGYDTFSGSFGVHAVRVSGTTWEPLGGLLDIDPSSDAQAPAVAIDADGAPLVAWRELIDGRWRGLLARWNGAAWVEVGGHVWSDDPARALVRPGLALLRGRVPLVAWSEQPPGAPTATTVRTALWNGPSTPPAVAARASIAGCAFDGTQATLSATGCFAIAAGHATPHPGLVPFDLTSELWSDGALKRRWVALPDGQSLTTPPTGAWTAPPGTMIIKEFAYETTPGAALTRRVMETRFLINGARPDAWQGFSFRWRPDGSDADLLSDADTVAWPLDSGMRHAHVYPSRAQCTRCHHPSNGPLLGLRTAQLARRFDYDGIIADQLETLAALGAIPPPPAQPVRTAPFTSPHDTSAPLELRVRGYLAANCSHCHNPTGERPTRDLRWETPLDKTMLCGPDAEVVAGDPASSVLVQRISARPGMPPLATLATDPLVIDLATRWIAGETNCP